jgi:hypothetical protein
VEEKLGQESQLEAIYKVIFKLKISILKDKLFQIKIKDRIIFKHKIYHKMIALIKWLSIFSQIQ